MPKINKLPHPRAAWSQLVAYEMDATKDPEFRAIACTLCRQELLEELCEEVGLDAPEIAAFGWAVLMDAPTSGATRIDRANFAKFRQLVRDRVLPVWSKHHLPAEAP